MVCVPPAVSMQRDQLMSTLTALNDAERAYLGLGLIAVPLVSLQHSNLCLGVKSKQENAFAL